MEAERFLSWIFESKKLEALVAELDGVVEGVALFYEELGTLRPAVPLPRRPRRLREPRGAAASAKR